jgi:single-stranded-DNA-specific exonuclease
VISAIAACSKYLEGYGGHAMAAGLTIRAERIDSFREAFNDEIRSHTSPDTFHQTLNIAGSISLHELEESLYRQLEQLAPYGRENPEPVFLFEDLKYVRPVRLFGRNHVKLVFQSPTMPIEAVGFGLGKYNWSRAPSKLAGTLEWDDYRERVQIRIVDWLAG